MSKHSFVTLNAAAAKALAESKLARIERARDRDRQEFIEDECKRQNNGFFHKLFRRKSVMPLQVIQQQQNMSAWESELWSIENIRYGRSKELAEQVLIAVQHGDPIQLSLDDMERLS